jgi:PAS domain S-box-containing protein
MSRVLTKHAVQQCSEALATESGHLPEVLDALPAAVYLTDKAGRITFYNEAAATLWGCRPTIGSAEWCGSWRLYWPDGTPLPHDQCPMAMALKEERAINGMEAAAERPDGTRVPFLAFPRPLRDDKGAIVGAINMLVDVSERKRIEVQARDAEERFRRLFETAPMAVFVCDKNAVIQDFNAQAVELWGRAPVRGVEKHCGSVKLWLPDGTHLPHEQSPLRDVLSTGIPVRDVEVTIERPDGSLLPVLVNFAPLWDANEEIAGAITSFVDISGRKSIEEAAQRLASIVESSDDAIISKDLNGIIKTWNTAAERLFGYLAEEIVGKSVTTLIPPERENEEPAILERLARGERIDHYETVRRRKDGTLIDVSLTVSPVRDRAGKIIGASKIVRDIAERKRKETQIALLMREVDHRSKNLLALVQAVVHLSKGDTPEAIKASIAGRVQALSNAHSLLAQSRWEGAELDRLVKEELAPYLKDGDSQARVCGPHLMLEPDTGQSIAVVLHELATNAVKYGALSVSTGNVRVEWSQAANNRLAIRWTETGGPPVKAPSRQGFGTRVIDQMIRSQLKGEIRFDWRRDGLACEIGIPREALAATHRAGVARMVKRDPERSDRAEPA